MAKTSQVLFSVIIPTLNEELFLPHLLTSLAGQSFRNFEVIVSDGHSSDKTVALAKTYSKKLPHLKVVENDTASLPMQRNSGATRATGKWFLFVDADSVLYPHSLERMNEFIASERPSHFSPWFAPDSAKWSDALMLLCIINAALEGAMALKRPVAFGPFSAIRRDVFRQVHGYDESLGWGEDNDISRRIKEAGYPFHLIRETLVVYSLRRVRKYGTAKTMRLYARAAVSFVVTQKTMKNVPNYIMGGQIYSQKKENTS